ERARQLCVARTNEYRARVGVAPVGRRPDAEACGDAQARADGQSGTAHGAFGQCRERAQNECPAWRGTPDDVVERCLAMMFAEGPGSGPAHGHYNNMTDRKYTGVACGIAQMPSGELWVVQNLY
ncbi:MAG TPA: CAP domain-containing protein, partial [Polyangiaceae bacterium]|nr:CAP domain-containing protein [Polyangiaceae bacterium]